METTTVNPTTFPQANATGSASQTAPVLSSDFETFLKMLTAQARFQDPLEPIDSTEYAAQLAQFSMVEQQVKSNDLLTALAAQLGSSNMAQMAGWIGMEARTTAPTFFDGLPINLDINPAPAADAVELVVYDANGIEAQRMSLPPVAGPAEWAGVTQQGDPFPYGTYSFQVESRANGNVIATDKLQTYTRITEARLDGGETVLILEGDTAVYAKDVSGLRTP